MNQRHRIKEALTLDRLRLQAGAMTSRKRKDVRRKPRADAQRNRERILAVAKGAFSHSGADISLDEVAKQCQ